MTGATLNIPQQVVRLGLRCNERCVFCNVPPDSQEPAGFELAARAIYRAAAKGGHVRVSISGGEPTLYPELTRLIAYGRKKGVEVELQTNGLKLAARKDVENLVRAGLTHAFVSLHSHIPKIHDFHTRVPGSWEACVKAVGNFIACGVETVLNPVVTAVNASGLPAYVRFVGHSLNGAAVSLSVVQPRGRALENRAIVPDYLTLNVPVRAALKIASSVGVTIRNPICGLPLCVGGWHKYPECCVEYSLGKLGLPFTEMKEKGPFCGKCAAFSYCAGVWKEYAMLYGFKALKPLTKKNFCG